MTLAANEATVVITAYNGERHIARCIDSALEQTPHPSSVFVVDDGSCDATSRVVASYSSRARLVRLTSNNGPPAGRTTGLEQCTTEYVGFLDADDFRTPAFIRETISFLAAHPGVVAVSTGNCKRHWQGQEQSRPDPDGEDSDYYGEDGAVCSDCYQFWSKRRAALTGAVTMRTQAASQTGGQRADQRRTRDLEFWGYLAAFGPWAFIPKPLFVTDERALTPKERLAKFERDFLFFRNVDVDDWARRIRPRQVCHGAESSARVSQVPRDRGPRGCIAGRRRRVLHGGGRGHLPSRRDE
jgi:glycosyltransferase involved in cell wall biosynthesis